MAALNLRCGVDQVWGDSFDSEMQEWEEQLQEMQQQIEELYKVVEARRSASNSSPSSSTHLDIALLPLSNAPGGRGVKVNDTPVPRIFNRHGDHLDTPCSDQAGFPGSGTSVGGPVMTLDILDGYLGLETELRLNQHQPCGAPNTSSKAHRGSYSHHDGAPQRPATNRIGCVPRRVSWREPVWCPQQGVVSEPPRRSPVRPTRYPDDRRRVAVDRKCTSPSVLRKFEAMLQENEGKTLIEGGAVTAPKVGGHHRGPRHTLVQKCVQGAELQPDTRMVERILGNCPASRQQAKSSGESDRRSFSRPARPANQRPPSRWASHAPVGPRSRSLSPTCKRRQHYGEAPNFGSYAETVIM